MDINTALAATLLFLFGSAVGSFINVIALRFREERKLWDWSVIGGRSKCPHCRRVLSWYELIPVLSFIIQFGKCRACAKPLSLQYPLVEIITGAAWVFVPMRILAILPSAYIAAALFAAAFSLFILLALIDMRLRIIPDELNVIIAVLGALIALEISKIGAGGISFLGYYAMLFGHAQNIVVNRILASAIGFLFLGAIVFLTRGKAMGMGDVKFAIPLGILFGFPDIVAILAFAFIIGAIISVPLLLNRRKRMKDAVPFGPFLVLSSALVFFFGFQIFDLYFYAFMR